MTNTGSLKQKLSDNSTDHDDNVSGKRRGLWASSTRLVGCWLLLVVLGTALFFGSKSYVRDAVQVEGSSMSPTLQNGQVVRVYKLARSWARLRHSSYMPKRGEIVVFNGVGLPAPPSTSPEADIRIKRIIGLPGDRVRVQDGVITVFDDMHPAGFNPDQNAGYAVVSSSTHDAAVDVTVPAGMLFVCGDNRPGSFDSRRHGPIDANSIIGVAVVH
jgi:signal peptidase I